MIKDHLLLDHLTADSGSFFEFVREVATFRSRFQDVKLVESESYGLMLLLDGKVQSTQVDEFIYHEALVHPAMLSHPEPRNIYIAGGGEGAVLREVLRYGSVEEVVMADLDDEVVRICRDYLGSWHQGAFDDPRTKLVFEDARSVLMRDKSNYDVIICDLSEPVDDGPSYMLFTHEFYRLCQERLNPGGILVTQSGCPNLVYARSFHSVTLTMESVFKTVAPYLAFIPSFGSNWGFTIGSDRLRPLEIPVEELTRRMDSLDGDLRFLDPGYLTAMFRLPKHLKDIKYDVGRVIRDGEPLIVV
jgi:spermidine synthase